MADAGATDDGAAWLERGVHAVHEPVLDGHVCHPRAARQSWRRCYDGCDVRRTRRGSDECDRRRRDPRDGRSGDACMERCDAAALVSLFHPDMVWPWPAHSRAHDPVGEMMVLGRVDRERWMASWQAIFDTCDLVHDDRRLVKSSSRTNAMARWRSSTSTPSGATGRTAARTAGRTASGSTRALRA